MTDTAPFDLSYHLPRRGGARVARRLPATIVVGDGAGPEHGELTRLRTENLALKAELIELKLVVGQEAAAPADVAVELRVRQVCHLVKNDFQLVLSLLRSQSGMQRRQQGQEAAAAALDLVSARVMAIAQVYGLLCSGDGFVAVAFDRYLREIAAALAELLGIDGRQRALVVDAEAVMLAAEVARSLGLVVNELVSNAFRHAFAADGPGTVRIEFGRDAGGRLRLAVSDDGAGLPAGFVPGAGFGLGLRLVAMTARQLGATFTLASEDYGSGTCAALTLLAER